MPRMAIAEATRIAVEHRAARTALPGFGHPTHKPDDPRAQRLLELARERKVAGRHVAAIAALSAAIDATYGRHITINATGAIAAVLGDCGVPGRDRPRLRPDRPLRRPGRASLRGAAEAHPARDLGGGGAGGAV